MLLFSNNLDSNASSDSIQDNTQQPWYKRFTPSIEIVSALQGNYYTDSKITAVPTSFKLQGKYELIPDSLYFIGRFRVIHGRFKYGPNDESGKPIVDQYVSANDIANLTINDKGYTYSNPKYMLDKAELIINPWKPLQIIMGVLDLREFNLDNTGFLYDPVLGSVYNGFISQHFNRLVAINAMQAEQCDTVPALALQLDLFKWMTLKAAMNLLAIEYHIWTRNSGVAEADFRWDIADRKGNFQIIYGMADAHATYKHRFTFNIGAGISQELFSGFYIWGRYSIAEKNFIQRFFGTYRQHWNAGLALGFSGDNPENYKHYILAGYSQITPFRYPCAENQDCESSESYAEYNAPYKEGEDYGNPEHYISLLYRIEIIKDMYISPQIGLILNPSGIQKEDDIDDKILIGTIRYSARF